MADYENGLEEVRAPWKVAKENGELSYPAQGKAFLPPFLPWANLPRISHFPMPPLSLSISPSTPPSASG